MNTIPLIYIPSFLVFGRHINTEAELDKRGPYRGYVKALFNLLK